MIVKQANRFDFLFINAMLRGFYSTNRAESGFYFCLIWVTWNWPEFKIWLPTKLTLHKSSGNGSGPYFRKDKIGFDHIFLQRLWGKFVLYMGAILPNILKSILFWLVFPVKWVWKEVCWCSCSNNFCYNLPYEQVARKIVVLAFFIILSCIVVWKIQFLFFLLFSLFLQLLMSLTVLV